jgi:hypothetical protein
MPFVWRSGNSQRRAGLVILGSNPHLCYCSFNYLSFDCSFNYLSFDPDRWDLHVR